MRRRCISATITFSNYLGREKLYSRVRPQRFVISALIVVSSVSIQLLVGTLESHGAAVAQQPVQGSVSSSEVSRLLKEMTSSDDQVRWQSLLQLQAVTPVSSTAVAVPSVINALLNDSSPAVRGQAAEALSHLPYTDASIKALFSVLNDPQEDVRWRAANSIPAKKRFLPYIVRALKNQDWEVVTRMLAKIETLGAEAVSAVPALTQELSDTNPVVRSGAARALLKIGAAAYAAGPALMTSLRKEQDPVARSCEVRALVRTGGATASDIPDLIRLLKDDRDPSTRYNAAKIIGNLGSVAQPALTDLVITMNSDPNSLVRCYCAEALGNIGPAAQPAIADLIRFLEDRLKDNYRHQAAVALGKIAPANDAKVTKVLLSALMDKSADVKAYAARGLALLHAQDPRVVPALQSLASDSDAKIKRAASESLKQLALEAEVKSADEQRSVDLAALSSHDVLVRFSVLRRLKAMLATRPNEAPAYVAVDVAPDLILRLTKILSDSDQSNRALAAESLGLMGAKASAAIPTLLVHLSSSDHVSARCAARALATVGSGDSRVIAELTRLLSAGGVGADAFADALAAMGKPGVHGLVVGVESASPMSAYYAAQALGTMGAVAKDAVPALIAVVEDTKSPVETRSQAADALGKIDPNNPEVAEQLKKLEGEKILPSKP